MPKYLSTDPNAGAPVRPSGRYLSTDPNAGLAGSTERRELSDLERLIVGQPEEDDRSFVGKAADFLVPTALRVGGAIAGGVAGGAISSPTVAGIPAGIIGGGAAGAGLGETLAELYEKFRGQREEVNPTQIATQAALGAVPVIGKAGQLGKTILSRAGQGAVLGGVGAGATQLAEGEDLSAGAVLTGAGLGAVLGGAGGGLESKLATSAAAKQAAMDAAAAADDPLVRLRTKQNNPELLVDTSQEPGLIDDIRTKAADQFHEVREFMRRGGADPYREVADTNPAKQVDLAFGGTAGKVEAFSDEYKQILDEARKLGVEQELQDVLNLHAMEAGAEALSKRAQREALEAAIAKADRTIGREAEQIDLIAAPSAPKQLGFDDVKELKDFPVRQPARGEVPEIEPSGDLPGVFRSGEFDNATQQRLRPAKLPRPGQLKLDVDAGDVAQANRLLEGAQTAEALGARVRDVGPAADDLTGTQLGLFKVPQEPEQLNLSIAGKLKRHPERPFPSGSGDPRVPDVQAPAVAREAGEQARQLRLKPQVLPKGQLSLDLESPDLVNALIERAAKAEALGARVRAKQPLSDNSVKALAKSVAEQGVLTETRAAEIIRAADRKGLAPTFILAELRDLKKRTFQHVKHPGLEAGEALPEGFTPAKLDEARESLKRLDPEKVKSAEQLARKTHELNEKMLDVAYEGGIVRPEVYRELKDRVAEARRTGRAGYAPLQRIHEELEQAYKAAGMNLPKQHAIYKLEGSERTTRHPLEASIRRMAATISDVEKNKALHSLVKLRDRGGYFSQSIKPLQGDAQPPKGFDVITLFDQGTAKKFAVPQLLADTLKGLDGTQTGAVMETLLRFTGGILRKGATTANLAFSIPNVVRDIGDKVVLDNSNRILPARLVSAVGSWAKAFKQVVQQSPEYQRYLRAGAAFSTFQRQISDPQRFLKGLDQGNKFNPLSYVETFNDWLENATKLSAFNEKLAQGLSEVEAAWQTRMFGGSPDFARRGTHMTQANLLVPFLNAQVQGLARTAQAFRRNPKLLGEALAYTTGTALTLHALNSRAVDPDGTPSLSRISKEEKENNLVLIIPGMTYKTDDGIERNRYVKLPIPHAVQLLYAPIRQVLDPSDESVVQQALDVVGQLAPANPKLNVSDGLGGAIESGFTSVARASNPLIKVPVELAANKSTFTGTPIVPRGLEDVEPSEQTRPSTSPTMAKLAGTLNLSPLKVEHFVRGFGGGVADMALALVDWPQEGGRKGSPLTRRFVGRSNVSEDVRGKTQLFYRALNESQKAHRTVSKLIKEGNEARAEEFLAKPKFARAYMQHSVLQKVSRTLSALRKEKDGPAQLELLNEVEKFLKELEREQEADKRK